MADQWPDVSVFDGDFTVAEPISLPLFSSPVRATTAEYTFTQEWMVARKNFAPTPLNTPHPSAGQFPDYSAYILVSEGPRQDFGGGVVKWQRTYAKVPDTHDEFESYSYSFIGIAGFWEVGNVSSSVTATGRPRTTHLVSSRVRHEYFKTGPGTAYPTPGDIPSLEGLKYFAGATPGPNTGFETDFVNDAVGLLPATSPSRTIYNGWVANSGTLGWNSGCIVSNDAATWTSVRSPSGVTAAAGQFMAEDSRISRWMGNVWLRQSRFIRAQ